MLAETASQPQASIVINRKKDERIDELQEQIDSLRQELQNLQHEFAAFKSQFD